MASLTMLSTGSVDSSTMLILANALYFKGAWEKKFEASETRDVDFHLVNGSLVKVPFMTSMEIMQKACSYSSFKVLGLPYEQGGDTRRHCTMYFFLPDAKDGLPALIEKMSSAESGFLERHVPFKSITINLKIPRFKTQFGFETSDILKGLGVVAPFSDGGLTEMVDSPLGKDLFVSNVFHKAFIEVNEEGTEAAAGATACVEELLSYSESEEEIMDFMADHTFLYLNSAKIKQVRCCSLGIYSNPLQG